MSTWNVTEADRDGQGQIALDAPRKLADLLPSVEQPEPAPARPLSGRQVGALAGVALVLIVALVALLAQPQATPAPRPTAGPTAVPSPPPTAAPAPRQVVAYAAPGGAVLGPIPAGAAPVARYGVEWVQVPHDGAAVWIRAEGDVDLALPDLATPEPLPTASPATTAPAAAPAAPSPCNEHTALYRVERQVEYDGIPIGKVTAWSCESAEDAEQQAADREAALIRGYSHREALEDLEADREADQ